MIAMKITSHTTLVTGSDKGPVDHPPGTPVDLRIDEARDLIARSIAWTVGDKHLPEASDVEREAPAITEPRELVEGDTVQGVPNLNASSLDELRNGIKGVGKKTAGDIIASREADGPFESLESAAERVGGVSLEQLQAAGVTL